MRAKSLTAGLVLVVLCASAAWADHTAMVNLTDAQWNPLGPEMPAGADTAYVQVWEPDLSGALPVTFLSDSEMSGEGVILTEVSGQPGYFRGKIPLDVQGFQFVSPEELEAKVSERLAILKASASKEPEAALRIRAEAEVRREVFAGRRGREKRFHAQPRTEDGKLQVSSGDVITARYEDASDDYGNAQTITDEAVYGGWSGSVSGVWTLAESPYVVTGDIYVDSGDSLRIMPGVEVRFFGPYSFYLYGGLKAEGTEQDTISFAPYGVQRDSTGMDWSGGIYFSSMWDSSAVSAARLSYCVVERADMGVTITERSASVEHSRIHGCNQEALGIQNLRPWQRVTVSDCLIEDNCRNQTYSPAVALYNTLTKDQVQLTDCRIRGNYGGGIMFSYGAAGEVSGCEITGNGYAGVQLSSSLEPSQVMVNHCDLYGNGWMDVYTWCCDHTGEQIDFRQNNWGSETTAEMNLGGNPKNITRIYDWWDSPDSPVINYSHWLGSSGNTYTAVVTLTDGQWNPLGPQMPAGVDTAYVQVWEPDRSGALPVTFLSESEVSGEGVILTEVSGQPGYFRGKIPLDVQGFQFVSQEELEAKVSERLATLKASASKEPEAALRIRAEAEVRREVFTGRRGPEKRFHAQPRTEDGKLQVSTGDVVTVRYEDASDDYGNAQTITDEAVYGGWSGSVSGVWTLAESPYVVTGDIYVDSGDSLRIMPGVEVRFFGPFNLLVFGGLKAEGTAQDTISFAPYGVQRDSTGMDWSGGIFLASEWDSSAASMSRLSYCAVDRADMGVNISGRSASVEHSRIHGCNQGALGIQSLSPWQRVTVSDCLIEDNCRDQTYSPAVTLYDTRTMDQAKITDCRIRGNHGGGIMFSYGAAGEVSGCEITGNGYAGVQLSSSLEPSQVMVNHCDLYGNGWMDVYTWCCDHTGEQIDFRQNNWGTETTAEMNLGGNPKNITRISDWWDSPDSPVINYSHWLGSSGNTYTAMVTLTDGQWNPLGPQMPAGADTAYVQVWEPDLSGALPVTFLSDSEVSGEGVILTEVSGQPGYFRGKIPLDVQGFQFISPEELGAKVSERLASLKASASKEPEAALRIRAEAEVRREVLAGRRGSEKRFHAQPRTEDGKLQVSTGDVVTVRYEDASDDYGNAQTITDHAVYGGWSGSVSGVWTLAESPYVVTGDIYVDSGDSLRIMPGVEVRFFGPYSFYLFGGLRAEGTAQDTISFAPYGVQRDSTGMDWSGGIFFSSLWDSSAVSAARLSCCVVERADMGVTITGRSASVEHSRIHGCNQGALGIQSLSPWQRVTVSDCLFEDNCRDQTYSSAVMLYATLTRDQVKFTDCRIRGNYGGGIMFSYGAAGEVSGCEITGNGYVGVQLSSSLEPSQVMVNHCDLYGNGWMDVYTWCCDHAGEQVDFRQNYWGEETTAEMDLGGNPKNITRISDWWDEPRSPAINYAQWLGTTVDCRRDIPLRANRWEWVTVGVRPDTLVAWRVFSSLWPNLDIVRDDQGGAYVPALASDTLSPIDITNGFELFLMNNPDTLSIQGRLPIPEDDCIPIAAGRWNLIPYLTGLCDPSCADDIVTAMAAIADSVEIVKDDDGMVWIPAEGINNIGMMSPHKTYRIFLSGTEDKTLCYPRCGMGPAKTRASQSAAAPVPKLRPVETGLPETVIFTSVAPGALSLGDEVRISDGETLVGAAVYMGTVPFAVTVWKGDPEHRLPGFTAGHPMTAQLWDGESGRTLPVELSTESGGPPLFVFHPYAKVGLEGEARAVISEFRLLSVQPHPIREQVEIRYQIPQADAVKLEIFDVSGRVVRIQEDQRSSAGVYTTVWAGTDGQGHRVGSGIYFARLRAGSAQLQRRLIVIR